MQRTVGVVVTGVLAAGVLAGCSGAGRDPATAPQSSPAHSSAGATATSSGVAPGTPTGTSDAVWAGATVPDGTWAKTFTARDVARLGIRDEGVLESLGRDGESTVTLKLVGDRFTQFGDDAQGVTQAGDFGSLAYDEDGHLLMTSENLLCNGCRYTYGWHLSGDRLELTMLAHRSPESPAELRVVRLVTTGTFVRQR